MDKELKLEIQKDRKGIKTNRNYVASLAKGLKILECFQIENRYLGNREIADKTGLPKATVSRLVYTLTQLGYLKQSEGLNKYCYGPEILSLSYSLLSSYRIRAVARGLMQNLAEYSQGAVNIAVSEGLNMVYLDTYRNVSSLLIQLDVGSKLPLNSSALGRAYLCAISKTKRNEMLDRIREEDKLNWPEVKAGVDKALDDYNTYGYCQSLGDWRNEVNAVGVPLILNDGFGVVSFSCGGPSFLMTEDKIKNDIGPRLRYLVRNVEVALDS